MITSLVKSHRLFSFRLPISKSPVPFTNTLGTVPNAPLTTGITVTFMFYNFSSSPARSKYLPLFSISFIFTRLSAGTAKSTIQQVLFLLLLTITRPRLLVGIRLFFCISKFKIFSSVPFTRIDSGFCMYFLFQ